MVALENVMCDVIKILLKRGKRGKVGSVLAKEALSKAADSFK